MSGLPIADYAMLSDLHSAALVGRAGSVDWLCLPRFDSPSVFARLLDDQAGHWSLRPADASATATRAYAENTLALRTRWQAATGVADVVDALALGPGERDHDIGLGSPGVLLREATCLRGEVAIALEYAPRPEYGRISPLLHQMEGGVRARGGADVLALSSPIPLDIVASVARGRVVLHAGETVGFALQRSASWEPAPQPWTQTDISARLADTLVGWRSWSVLHQRYAGPWRELVHHSGRVLQGLTFRPTGAIVAAPTTSLPEVPGGVRNWDYRYTWVCDASFTLDALWVAACPDEAHWFFEWMAGTVAAQLAPATGGMADLQIMFGVGGEHDLSERALPRLRGWRESRPVRVGNAAWEQRQIDVYGALLGAVRRLRSELQTLDEATCAFLIQAADRAAARWREPDQGIWEMRGPARHFLYSKLMCWVALDSAIALADVLHAEARVAEWTATRDQIRAVILSQGWSEHAGAYSQAFGSDDLDASALMLTITGFLPASDVRMRQTIDAIAERLTDERGLVHRYQTDDGLEGSEGAFLLCTFWLAQALAQVGAVERARATFERAIAAANDVGLLAEEVDAATGELLGNFPQAFSHIGLVNAAWAIAQAEQAAQQDQPTR